MHSCSMLVSKNALARLKFCTSLHNFILLHFSLLHSCTCWYQTRFKHSSTLVLLQSCTSWYQMILTDSWTLALPYTLVSIDILTLSDSHIFSLLHSHPLEYPDIKQNSCTLVLPHSCTPWYHSCTLALLNSRTLTHLDIK